MLLIAHASIAGAEQAAQQLRGLGLPAAAIHSQLDAGSRRAVLARFAGGDLHVIAAPQVLDEGIDVPAADLAVIVAASRSRRQMIQRMGRVLRRKPDGRPACFIIVYATATVEDPALGAHEGFLDEITPVAAAVHYVSAVDRLCLPGPLTLTLASSGGRDAFRDGGVGWDVSGAGSVGRVAGCRGR